MCHSLILLGGIAEKKQIELQILQWFFSHLQFPLFIYARPFLNFSIINYILPKKQYISICGNNLYSCPEMYRIIHYLHANGQGIELWQLVAQ